MASPSLELVTPEAQAVGARSALYKTLSRSFRAPSEPFYEELKAGQVAESLRQAIAALPYELTSPGDLGAGSLSFEALDSAYLAYFEVGGEHGAPCFLYEGEHGGGRMKVLDDILRFYHYFDLHLNQEKRERPDHLATELEFMHALTFREAAVQVAGGNPAPLRQAQRDFLRFHLQEFVSAVGEKLQSAGGPVYPALARCAAAFCQKELSHLNA